MNIDTSIGMNISDDVNRVVLLNIINEHWLTQKKGTNLSNNIKCRWNKENETISWSVNQKGLKSKQTQMSHTAHAIVMAKPRMWAHVILTHASIQPLVLSKQWNKLRLVLSFCCLNACMHEVEENKDCQHYEESNVWTKDTTRP